MEKLDPSLYASIGVSEKSFNKFIEDGLKYYRRSPRLRFDMPLSEAFGRIMRQYQYEVQSRDWKFKIDENLFLAIKKVAENMVKAKPIKGFMFCGLYGTGKSTLSKAIINVINDLNKEEHFHYDDGDKYIFETQIVKSIDVCHWYKADKDDIIKQLKTVPVLLIDDIGVEPQMVQVYGDPFFAIREILEVRNDKMLFTILSTNLTSQQIRDFYESRITDRFREMVLQIPMKGESYRIRNTRKE